MALTYDEFASWAEQAEAAVPQVLSGFARRVRKFPNVVIPFLPKIEQRMRDPQLQTKWRKMGIPIPASLRIRTPEPERRTPPPAAALGIEEARRILAHAVEKFRDWRSSQAAVPA
jgi:hypothetical protein